MLLGRRLRLTFGIPGADGKARKTIRTARVLSVNYLMQADYSVHVRFGEPLTAAEKTSLQRLSSGPAKNHQSDSREDI